MKLRHALLATTVLGAICGPNIATAQVLEEVTVTARKTEENLMQVPLAITALGTKDIESRAVQNIQDLAQYTPGLFAVNQTGGGSGRNDRSNRTVAIRGFSVSSALIFLDGAPVNGVATPEIEDVQRVEVLKGPQSAYFGRSTFSGAINYVTKAPATDGFHGRVKAEFYSYNSTDDSVSVEGPVAGEKLAMRVSGHYLRQGGQYNNFSEGTKLGEQTTKSGSLQIAGKLSDNFRYKGFFTFLEEDDGPPAQFAIKGSPGNLRDMNCFAGGTANVGGVATPNPWYCGQIPNYNAFPASYISSQYALDAHARSIIVDNVNHFPTAFDPHFLDHGGFRLQAYQADFNMDYDFADGWTASSLTAYHKEKGQTISNLSFRDGQGIVNTLYNPTNGSRPYILWLVATQSRQWDFSQELRVTSPKENRFRVLAGASYIRINNPGGTGVYGETPLGSLVLSSTTRNLSKTPSVFGGAYYDVIPQVTISGEVRYQWDKIVQQALTTSSGAYSPGFEFQQTYTSTSPRVTIDWKYADNSTAYVLWSRGYRPGGFNTTVQIQPASVQAQFTSQGVGISYQQERLDNFEIGVKSTWLDGRARTTIAAYKELWRQGQNPVTIFFTLPSGGVNSLSPIVNIGAANLWGGEFNADFQVTEHLVVSGTFGYTDSKLLNFVCADCLTVLGNNNGTGKKLPNAPKYQWALGGEYTSHLMGDYDWFTRVDYSHRGKLFIDYSNTAQIGSKDNINLRVGMRSDKLTLEAYVKNLTNNKTALAAAKSTEALFTSATGQEIRVALPDKRWMGIRASYNF